MHDKSRLAFVALLTGAVGIAFAPVFVRLSEVGPSATAFYRLLLALPVLWLWRIHERTRPGATPHPASSKEHLQLAVAGLLFEVAYFAGFWSTAGQTPGMRLMHLRVVDRAGSAPGFGRSLVRVLGLALAILFLCTGFLPALIDDRRRALQDFLASTTIVYDDGPDGFS